MLEESMSAIPSIWASMNSWLTPTVLFVLLNLMIGTIAITSSLATHKPSHDQHQERLQAQHQHSHNQLARSPSVLQRLKSVYFHNYRSQEPNTLTYDKPSDFDHHFTLQESVPQHESHQTPQVPLSRSSSILQKLMSINFSCYFYQEPITTTLQKNHEIYFESREEKQFLEQEEQHQQDDEGEEEKEQFEDNQEQTLDEIYRKLQSNNKVSSSISDTKPAWGEEPTKLPRKLRKSASVKSTYAHLEDVDVVESRRPATVREGKSKVTEEDDAEVDAKADDFINSFKQQLKLQRVHSIIKHKEMINGGSSGS